VVDKEVEVPTGDVDVQDKTRASSYLPDPSRAIKQGEPELFRPEAEGEFF